MLSRLDTVSSKFVFATKFPRANLALKTSAAKVLNSEVVIYLPWSWSVSFLSISVIFVLSSASLTELLTLGVLFSTVVNAVFVPRLLTSGISPSISVILVL